MPFPRFALVSGLCVVACLAQSPAPVANPACEAVAEVEELIQAQRDDDQKKREELAAAWAARHTAEPDDPRAAYLYARSLIGRRTSEAIRVLESTAASHPEFPWSHLGLAEIRRYPNFQDDAQSRAHARRFVALCPASLAAYGLLRDEPDLDYLRSILPQFRQALAAREDASSLHTYRMLWALEFRAQPAEGHAALREQVKSDVARIRALPAVRAPMMRATLMEGAKLARDTALIRQLEDETKAAGGPDARMARRNEFFRAHPIPGEDAPKEKRDAAWRAWRDEMTEWLAEDPQDYMVLERRLAALSNLDETTEAELVAAAQALLALDLEAKRIYTTTPPETLVAQAYLRKQVRLRELPVLIESGLAKAESRALRTRQSDLFPAQPSAYQATLMPSRRQNAYRVMAAVYRALGEFDKARAPLRKAEDALAEHRAILRDWESRELKAADPQSPMGMRAASDLRNARINADSLDIELQREYASLALAENHKLDALTRYGRGLAVASGMRSGAYYVRLLKPSARHLWDELGGTPEGWAQWEQQWSAPPAAETPDAPLQRWMPVNRLLPQETLTDLAGKTVTVASLRGKLTFINVWATWCAPCRGELPDVEKLYQRLKGRPDVALVTLNVDTNIGLVEPFLNETGYTFPVYLAADWAHKFDVDSGIPANWIVDRTGIVRVKSSAVGWLKGDAWVEEVLAQIDKVVAATASK